MRYWLWPRRLRLKKKPPKAKKLVRKRRKHLSARERLKEFGLNRLRYLWFIPVLIAAIIVTANIRVPKTVTALIQSASAQSESAAGIAVRAAKYRPSIPAGYTLAVDLTWRTQAQSPELLAELILRDESGHDAARETTVIGAGALSGPSPLTRAELDIPYNLGGAFSLSVRVVDEAGQIVQDEIRVGALSVY
jgi:hypothetical protein